MTLNDVAARAVDNMICYFPFFGRIRQSTRFQKKVQLGLRLLAAAIMQPRRRRHCTAVRPGLRPAHAREQFLRRGAPQRRGKAQAHEPYRRKRRRERIRVEPHCEPRLRCSAGRTLPP